MGYSPILSYIFPICSNPTVWPGTRRIAFSRLNKPDMLTKTPLLIEGCSSKISFFKDMALSLVVGPSSNMDKKDNASSKAALLHLIALSRWLVNKNRICIYPIVWIPYDRRESPIISRLLFFRGEPHSVLFFFSMGALLASRQSFVFVRAC